MISKYFQGEVGEGQPGPRGPPGLPGPPGPGTGDRPVCPHFKQPFLSVFLFFQDTRVTVFFKLIYVLIDIC